jgi:hypothetical protein
MLQQEVRQLKNVCLGIDNQGKQKMLLTKRKKHG